MDFDLPDDHELIRRTVRDFAEQEVAPVAEELDRTKSFPYAIVKQLGELGLSIPETASVARSLGMVDAMNLDGGGSTAMVVDGALISHPSDAAGERAVGDAIVIR